jgi:3-isopropylmalate/(R)-2-methylmalate dehydratase large subunit
VTQTLAEKIIARAAGRDSVTLGDIVTCKIDLAMLQDSSGPRRVAPILDRLGVKIWDPDKVVVINDHYVPAVDLETAAIQGLTREWVKSHQVKNFHDMQGICHVVVQEHGYLAPGMFVVGGDSHSPSGGAAGSFMFGIGATDMAGVLVTGETWIKVPGTYLIRWNGVLAAGVSAKDMMLATCGRLGMSGANYQVIEYAGPVIDAMSMTERLTLCNMSVEIGAMTGIIAPDETTVEAIRRAGGEPGDISQWRSDPDANYLGVHEFDATDLSPQVALPHSPDNVGPVRDNLGIPFDQAYIGACTGAKLEDLQMAAQILKGRRVTDGIRLLIAPASTKITTQAAADGTLEILTAAGAIMMPSGCGACAGYGAGVLSEGESCIASTARNFKGRMGPPNSLVYLASPYTVAATAVAGSLADPRELLEGETS